MLVEPGSLGYDAPTAARSPASPQLRSFGAECPDGRVGADRTSPARPAPIDGSGTEERHSPAHRTTVALTGELSAEPAICALFVKYRHTSLERGSSESRWKEPRVI